MSNGDKKDWSVQIVAAVIGGLCTIIAAIIGGIFLMFDTPTPISSPRNSLPSTVVPATQEIIPVYVPEQSQPTVGPSIELPTVNSVEVVPTPTTSSSIDSQLTPAATLLEGFPSISKYRLKTDQPFTEEGIEIKIYDWRVIEPSLAIGKFSMINRTQKDILFRFGSSQIAAYDSQENSLELAYYQYDSYCPDINVIQRNGQSYTCQFQVKADFSIVKEVIIVVKDLPRLPYVDWIIPIDLQ